MLRAKGTSKQALLALQARQHKMTEWLSLQTDDPQAFIDNYRFQESLFREALDRETTEEGDPAPTVAEKTKEKKKNRYRQGRQDHLCVRRTRFISRGKET